MSAELLLREFDRLAEAPDVIPRLRRLVLGLATRGRLTRQDPGDELEPPTRGSSRSIGAKQIPLSLPTVDFNGQTPHPLPTTWQWLRLGEAFKYDAGDKVDPGELDPDAWLLELEDIEPGTGRLLARHTVRDRGSKSTKSEFAPGDVLYGKLRPYLNKAAVADRSGYSTTEIVALRPRAPVLPAYAVLALRRPDFVDYVTRLGRGTKMPRLRTDDALAAPFPLPPFPEQQRIVAKVDELMALCDQLESAQKERESHRDALRAVTLHRLTPAGGHEDGARDNVRFFLDHSREVTTKPEHVTEIRQAIFDLSADGAIVSGGNGVGWASERLDNILALITDGDHATPPRIRRDERAIPLVTAKNVRDGAMDLADTDWVSRETATKSWARCYPKDGDVLMVCVGATIGRLCVLRDPPDMVLVRSVALLRPSGSLLPDYLALTLRSRGLQSQIKRGVKATGQPCLYLGKIQDLTVPVPPIAAQQQIIAKAQELTALCDDLEAVLEASQTQRSWLLEALLHQALEGGQA